MKTLTAKETKYGFGGLMDLARAQPVVVTKHARLVVAVMATAEFERLKALDTLPLALTGNRKAGA